MNQISLAQEAMERAQNNMNEANIWFNEANNAARRIEALIREVKALRSGVGVSYPDGCDPTNPNWKFKV